MHRGHLPYFKIGRWVRFREDDIHNHLQKYRIDRHNRFQPTRRSRKLEQAATNLAESWPLAQPGGKRSQRDDFMERNGGASDLL
jgi:hypothetical protein